MSGAGISYYSSQALLSSELGKIREKAMARMQPQAQSGGALLQDTAHPDSLPPVVIQPLDPPTTTTTARAPVQQAGRRYTKGRGLQGEVEEEGEMRDTYFRPGVPRNER